MNRIFLVALVCWCSIACSTKAAEKMRVVILTGSNNHQWAETTPVLEEILEQTGKFEVEVVKQPEQLTKKLLAQYDVLLSNWNNWQGGKEKPPAEWSDALKAAYIGFVKDGGGHVMVHAGSSSFFDWKEYQQICCATWALGQTRHGPVHEFEIRMTKQKHPITQGMKSFTTTDELWARPGVQEGVTMLAESYSEITQAWEPCAMINQVGKGRCFALMLGHAPENMRCSGFKKLLVNGTQWAATGK